MERLIKLVIKSVSSTERQIDEMRRHRLPDFNEQCEQLRGPYDIKKGLLFRLNQALKEMKRENMPEAAAE